jgi:hypothetical protein
LGEAVIQLCFPFRGGEHVQERPSKTTRYWQRKLAKTAAYAFELGKRRARKPKAQPTPKSLSSAAVSVTPIAWPTLPAPLRVEERHELGELARRVARLTVSRRDPSWFFEERSEIADELRRISGGMSNG